MPSDQLLLVLLALSANCKFLTLKFSSETVLSQQIVLNVVGVHVSVASGEHTSAFTRSH